MLDGKKTLAMVILILNVSFRDMYIMSSFYDTAYRCINTVNFIMAL